MIEIKAPYAEALLRIAIEHDCVEETRLALEAVTSTIYDNPDLLAVLNHPRILPKTKKNILNEVVGQRTTPIVRNFFGVLIDNGRTDLTRRITSAFHKKALNYMGCAEVTVTTAIPLEDEWRERLRANLEKRLEKKVILIETVDPAIKGGAILYYDGQVLDDSIRGRLDAYRYHLEKMF